MYSVKGDVVLDPFLGTGTTTAAAMTSGRDSIGVEIDKCFQSSICQRAHHVINFSNNHIHNRILRHLEFVRNKVQKSGQMKYTNRHYGFPVVTSQEQSLLLNELIDVQTSKNNLFEVTYSEEPNFLLIK